MTENPNLEHCSFAGCYTVDFLPVTCDICSKQFCSAHSFQDVHGCSEPAEDGSHNKTSNSRIPCSLLGCSNPSPHFMSTDPSAQTPVSCTDCSGIFCIAHRHQSSHHCAQIPAAKASKSQALAQKAIENVKTVSPSRGLPGAFKGPAKASKIKAIELMKMRRKAEPANPRDSAANIAMGERLFVTVSHGLKEKVLWVKKDEITGKALDLFASKLGIYTSPLTIAEEGCDPLRTDIPLASQVEDASKLIIERKGA